MVHCYSTPAYGGGTGTLYTYYSDRVNCFLTDLNFTDCLSETRGSAFAASRSATIALFWTCVRNRGPSTITVRIVADFAIKLSNFIGQANTRAIVDADWDGMNQVNVSITKCVFRENEDDNGQKMFYLVPEDTIGRFAVVECWMNGDFPGYGFTYYGPTNGNVITDAETHAIAHSTVLSCPVLYGCSTGYFGETVYFEATVYVEETVYFGKTGYFGETGDVGTSAGFPATEMNKPARFRERQIERRPRPRPHAWEEADPDPV